jgi:hypothetical protein
VITLFLDWTPVSRDNYSIMSDLNTGLSEAEIVDAVADALLRLGFAASSQDTGGGINCVILEHKDGGEIVWGTADVNWGAVITDANGDFVSSIETVCPSDSQDIAAIVDAIRGPSLSNDAAVSAA